MAKGARVVLLDNELWDGSPYRPALRRIWRIWVCRSPTARFISARAEHSARPRGQACLCRGGSLEFQVLQDRAEHQWSSAYFRSHGSAQAFFIVGVDPQLGSRAPNTIAMHDDGTGGDEQAGDGVGATRRACCPGNPCSTSTQTAGRCSGGPRPAAYQSVDYRRPRAGRSTCR